MNSEIAYLLIIVIIIAGVFFLMPNILEKVKNWIKGVIEKKKESESENKEKPLLPVE